MGEIQPTFTWKQYFSPSAILSDQYVGRRSKKLKTSSTTWHSLPSAVPLLWRFSLLQHGLAWLVFDIKFCCSENIT